MQQEWPKFPLAERKEIVKNGFTIIRLLTSVELYCDLIKEQCPDFFEHFSNLVIYNTDSEVIQREAKKIIRNFFKVGFFEFPIELKHFIAKHNLAEPERNNTLESSIQDDDPYSANVPTQMDISDTLSRESAKSRAA